MTARWVGLALLALVGLSVAALVVGAWRWRAATTRAIARLDAAAAPGATPSRYEPGMLAGLPAPVARYFRAVLRDGQPIPTRWRITQRGSFRMGEADDSWRPFTAVQDFRAMPPGMVWDATIRMAPGMDVAVRDAWVGGHGAMRGELLRLFPVVDARPDPALDAAALQRYLAEAVWCPTALLPVNGVRWAAIDDSTARATLTDAGVAVSLDFTFGPDGAIVRSHTGARARATARGYQPTPWGGDYADYGDELGMRVPRTAEVAWMLPAGRLPYWIGRLSRFEDLGGRR